jgi:hypothetical protein
MGEGSSSSQRMSFCIRRKLVGKSLTSQDLLTERNVEDTDGNFLIPSFFKPFVSCSGSIVS